MDSSTLSDKSWLIETYEWQIGKLTAGAFYKAEPIDILHTDFNQGCLKNVTKSLDFPCIDMEVYYIEIGVQFAAEMPRLTMKYITKPCM